MTYGHGDGGRPARRPAGAHSGVVSGILPPTQAPLRRALGFCSARPSDLAGGSCLRTSQGLGACLGARVGQVSDAHLPNKGGRNRPTSTTPPSPRSIKLSAFYGSIAGTKGRQSRFL